MTPTSYPLHFRVLPWERIDVEMVDPLGIYAETYWLPILHPTAYLLGRRFVTLARRAKVFSGERLELDAYDIAHAIGVSGRTDEPEQSRPSLTVYGRALKRLDRYSLVRIHGATVSVRDRWPRANSGLLSALALPMQLAEPDYWKIEAPVAPDFIER